MTKFWAGILVLVLAAGVYANSLGNGFAYDDTAVIQGNDLVTSGNWRAVLSSPYHPDALEGAGLYRPVTSLSFALEWLVFGEDPFGYHLLNILGHSLVCLLLFLLLLEFAPLLPAFLGATVFALHPVHTEAVANIVGRGELYSAFFFLLACLLYYRGFGWVGWRRYLRLPALGAFYGLSLGAKEMGVTLPLALLLLEFLRPIVSGRSINSGNEEKASPDSWLDIPGGFSRVRREAGSFALLFVVLVAYLAQRATVLGTVTGEVSAPVFAALGSGQRVLTAISLWAQYLRLLVFPVDLAADYAPGVLFPAESVDLGVLLGFSILLGLGYVVLRALRIGAPGGLVAAGILWFVLTILPVSNLLFPTGVLLAERTLYLPSMGLALVWAGLAMSLARASRPWPQVGVGVGCLVLLLFSVKVIHRNPAWESTRSFLETLNREHPESHVAFLNRGLGLEEVGDLGGAGEELEMALRLAPERYGTLTAVAGYLGRRGSWVRAEGLLRHAMAIAPGRDDAYRLLSAQFLRQERGREAHEVALAGLARCGFHPDLWGSVSESYLLRGDLPAALRAREAALSAGPPGPHHWNRAADILQAMGREEEAAIFRDKARSENHGGLTP